MKKLSIIIPAYNEEEAIRNIIEQTLQRKDRIVTETGLDDVEIIVVNDGSHDGTERIASEYSQKNLIRLITYQKNRGYGAAIKEGFSNATGDLLSFLDADGTCDPGSFIDMLLEMKRNDADLVIGGRLNSQSKMPLTRKVGNIFYRVLVNAISDSRISDVASGMRILKKEAFRKLSPLPDGLQFTPAMSMRAALDSGIRIAEVPIPYDERTGDSKLSIFRDGFRFLKSILEIAFTYKPLRLFGFVGGLFLLASLLYSIDPLLHYLQYKNVPEDRIYRLIFIVVAAVSGIQLLSTGLITQEMTDLAHNYESKNYLKHIPNQSFLKKLIYVGILCLVIALVMNHSTLYQYVTTRQINVHWSYVVAGGLLVLMGFQFLAFSIINRIITLLKEKKISDSAN